MQATQLEQTTERRLSPEEFAKVLNVSVTTIYRMLKRGEIVAAKVAGQWRINASATLANLGI